MDEPRTATEEAERQALIGHAGQVKEFRDAVKQALTTVNMEIAANGGQPAVDAVTEALTSVHAEFIAMAPDRNARRAQLAVADRNLRRLVALRASLNGHGGT
jgi:predicted nucleic acid-binding protein